MTPTSRPGARRRPRPGDTWHLNEVLLRTGGKPHDLCRAVEQHGVVLDILVQGRRNAGMARRVFKRLRYTPWRLITDGLRSYGVAQREILPAVRHRMRQPKVAATLQAAAAWQHPEPRAAARPANDAPGHLARRPVA